MTTAAEAPLITRRYGQAFALSTTSSLQDDPPFPGHPPVSRFGYPLLLFAGAPHVLQHLVPPPLSSGRLVFFESSISPATVAEAVTSSQVVTQYGQAQLVKVLRSLLCGKESPISDEIIDWEFSPAMPPKPTRTISVTLAFSGRGQPLPFSAD